VTRLLHIVIIAVLLLPLTARPQSAVQATATVGDNVAGPITVRVGILAFRGADKARRHWQPTLDYLDAGIPGYQFQLVPKDLPGLAQGTANGEFDFVFTTPGQYVDLEAEYGITRLATLINQFQGKPYKVFGSVIFTRTDNDHIHKLEDSRGQRLAGVAKQAFGGFQLAWYELQQAGIDPFSDVRELLFTGLPQDQIVYAVRDGRADVGTVRTNVLERMAGEGLIDQQDFRLLHPRRIDGFPFWLSTDLYPEWAFARTRRTDENLARRVAVALLNLPADSPAAGAGHYAGWHVPGNYNPIHDLYKAIRYGPYRHYGEFSFHDVLQRYWYILTLFTALLVLLAYHAIYTRHINRCLNLAKERAEAANLAKSSFLANMSHEIRTPLNAVLGYTQILRQADDIPDKYSPQLSAIASAGNHLLALINDILDLSRIEAGADDVAQEEFPLARLVDGLGSVFGMRCRDQDLVLVVNADLDPTRLVLGDPGKLRQVLYNLLGNAVKFTDHGEIHLRVHQDGDQTRFVVEDTGRGIAADELETLFDPFKQAEQGQIKGGTGLGLNIARRYVELMDGKLEVRAQPGKGSRFSFTIPLRVTNIGYHGPNDPGLGDQERFKLAAGQRLRALVVDDVEVNRSVLMQILGDAGVEVDSAANGEQALEKIAEQRPDIVWMDLRMPVMSGEQAVGRIRERYGRDIRCVAVTASSTGTDTDNYRKRGFDGLIPKPYSMEQVFSLAEELLGVRFERHKKPVEQTGDAGKLWTQLPTIRRQALREAADSHRITALKRELAAMLHGNPAEQALATRLQPLLARFDMDAVQSLIGEIDHD
jgi:signal transduction histidine kinase/DNA-binding response OmpR family regulator